MKNFFIILTAVVPCALTAAQGPRTTLDALIVSGALKLLSEKVVIVPNLADISMTDEEFDDFLQGQERYREHFAHYRASGALRDICYIYVPNISTKQTLPLKELLNRTSAAANRDAIVQRVVDHRYARQWAHINVSCPGELVTQLGVRDSRDIEKAAILSSLASTASWRRLNWKFWRRDRNN